MKIRLNNARLAFPAIWEPYKDSNKYNLKALLAPTSPDVVALENVITQVAAEKWGVKAAATLRAVKIADKTCLHNGDAKPEWEGFEGMVYVGASNKKRPMVLNSDKSVLTEADGVIYSGCMVNVVVDVWAQDNEFGKRVNATLVSLQFAGDNDAFSGGGAPADADDFDELGSPDSADADDPAA